MHIQSIPFPAAHGFLANADGYTPANGDAVTQTLVWDGNGFASMRVLVDRNRATGIVSADGWRDLTVLDAVSPTLAAGVATPDQLEGEPAASFSAVDSQGEPWITVEFYKAGEGQFRQALSIMWTLCSALERARPI